MTEPRATYRNGCIRIGRLPVGDDEARRVRDHMAKIEPADCLYPVAQQYVRDLNAALAESAREYS